MLHKLRDLGASEEEIKPFEEKVKELFDVVQA